MRGRYWLCCAWLAAAPAWAGGYTAADICKAALTMELGHDLGRLRITHSGKTPEIMYIAKQSRERLRYRCRLVGEDRVEWARYLDDKKDWGGWKEDAKLTYQQKGTHLIVKNAKGVTRDFRTADFRQ